MPRPHLPVCSHQQRHFAGCPVTVHQHGLPYRPALESDQTAHLVIPDIVQHAVDMILPQIGMHADHDKLRDLFFVGQGVKNTVYPAVCLALRFFLFRGLIFFM